MREIDISILVFALISMISTTVIMIVLRPLAVHLHLIDKPGGRKQHSGDVPLVGGLAMFLGITATTLFIASVDENVILLLIAGAMLVAVGAIDDRFGVSLYVRLLAQAITALLMVYGAGILISDLGNPFGFGEIELGRGAAIFSVIVAIVVINAFNFVDGVDGLAGSLAFIALAAFAISGGFSTPISVVAAISCGAILGFLIFNFPVRVDSSARAFMGDSGSTMLGLLVVWLGVRITQGEHPSLSPVTALWFAVIPLADFFSCFVRRLACGKSPLAHDSDHLHHMLLGAGLSSRHVVGVLAGTGALFALIGLTGHFLRAPDWSMFTLWTIALASPYFFIRSYAAGVRKSKEARDLRNELIGD